MTTSEAKPAPSFGRCRICGGGLFWGDACPGRCTRLLRQREREAVRWEGLLEALRHAITDEEDGGLPEDAWESAARKIITLAEAQGIPRQRMIEVVVAHALQTAKVEEHDGGQSSATDATEAQP